MLKSNKKAEPLAAKTAAEPKAAAPKTQKTAAAAEPKAEKAAAKAEKAAAAAKAKAEKTPVVRRRAAKKAEVKLYVQYQGKQMSQEEMVEAVKAAWTGAAIETLELYVKPEDGAVYYVINGAESGKVDF